MTTRPRAGEGLTRKEMELVAELAMIKRAMRELKTNIQMKLIGTAMGREVGDLLRPRQEEVQLAQLTTRAREIVRLLAPPAEPAKAEPVPALDPGAIS